jgi:hypothetical protein
VHERIEADLPFLGRHMAERKYIQVIDSEPFCG